MFDETIEFDAELKIPEFISNDLVFNPIIELFLIIDNQVLTLDKSESDIVALIMGTIDDTIIWWNSFWRPEFAKMQFISSYEFTKQEEEEETMNKLTFQHNKRENEFENLMFVGFERNIYSKYIGRIKLIESDKTDKDLIFTQEESNIF